MKLMEYFDERAKSRKEFFEILALKNECDRLTLESHNPYIIQSEVTE